MAESTINQQALEDAISKALRKISLHNLEKGHNPRTEFYEKFRHAADDHDHDTIKKCDEDLNTTLVFAGLFSAVASAFIIDVQSNLGPNFEEMNNALLMIVANAALNNVQTNVTLPHWDGPDPNIVRVQSILYSSLFASLLAALLAMFGKQWLNRYESAEFGSLIERSQLRMLKMDGIHTWKLGPLLECLPIILQIALILLSCALSDYLYFTNKIVAGTVIAFTSLGLLFYLLIGIAGIYSFSCPYQTPFSLTLRWLARLDNINQRYLKRIKRSTEWSGDRLSRFSRWMGYTLTGGNESPLDTVLDDPPPFSNEKIDWKRFALDSRCIGWVIEKPMDTDVTMAVTKFIPEIIWHRGSLVAPLKTLYDIVLECFDCSSGLPVLKPEFRDKAYFSAKALLHACIQNECLGGRFREMFEPSSHPRLMIGSNRYKNDSDLESILNMVDRIFCGFDAPFNLGPMRWGHFSFTAPHHIWMGHIFLYRARDALEKRRPLPDDVLGFLLHSVRSEPLPPLRVIADCLFIAGLVLGMRLNPNDFAVPDKSPWIEKQIDRIYKKLTEILENPRSSPEDTDNAMLAVEVIVSIWRGNSEALGNLSQKCYNLFHIIMESHAFFTESQKRVWPTSLLAIRGAYKLDHVSPQVQDGPQHILNFLYHSMELATKRGEGLGLSAIGWEEQIWDQEVPREHLDEGIQSALCALMKTTAPATLWDHEHFDPTENRFIHCIHYAFQENRPAQLTKVALFFLPLIGDRWFGTEQVMDSRQMRSFCENWASAVERIDRTHDVRKVILEVLFSMISSPHWRPHIGMDQWKLLEFFILVQEDSEQLTKCLRDPELVDEVLGMENPAVVPWLAILWMKYRELTPEVQKMLETVTRDAALGARRTALEACLELMDFRLRMMEDELEESEDSFGSGSARSTQRDMRLAMSRTSILRTRIDNIRRARTSLAGYM